MTGPVEVFRVIGLLLCLGLSGCAPTPRSAAVKFSSRDREGAVHGNDSLSAAAPTVPSAASETALTKTVASTTVATTSTATEAVPEQQPTVPPPVQAVTAGKPSLSADGNADARHEPPPLSAADRVLELLLEELALKHRLETETDRALRSELMADLNRLRDARDAIYAADVSGGGRPERDVAP